MQCTANLIPRRYIYICANYKYIIKQYMIQQANYCIISDITIVYAYALKYLN